jgi:hypothetical protein
LKFTGVDDDLLPSVIRFMVKERCVLYVLVEFLKVFGV